MGESQQEYRDIKRRLSEEHAEFVLGNKGKITLLKVLFVILLCVLAFYLGKAL